jgi:ABC-type proline/glycine betaine transport system permease subunit
MMTRRVILFDDETGQPLSIGQAIHGMHLEQSFWAYFSWICSGLRATIPSIAILVLLVPFSFDTAHKAIFFLNRGISNMNVVMIRNN